MVEVIKTNMVNQERGRDSIMNLMLSNLTLSSKMHIITKNRKVLQWEISICNKRSIRKKSNQVKFNGQANKIKETIETTDGNNKIKETITNTLESNKTMRTSGNSQQNRSIHNILESRITNSTTSSILANSNMRKKSTQEKHKICMISIHASSNTKIHHSINASKSNNTHGSNSNLSSNNRDKLANSMTGNTMTIKIDFNSLNPNSNKERDHRLVQDHSHQSSILVIHQVESHKLHSESI